MNKKITIAGLGWLGKPFAAMLDFYGYKVKGSVTDSKKAELLSKNGVQTYPILLTEEGVTGKVNTLLDDTDILVIMIPPGLRRNSGANYALKMAKFLHEIENSNISKVILISSTSAYADSQGVVTELDTPSPDTEAGRQLFEVEQLFFNSPTITSTVVRFGGLYGGSRNPVKFLAGRKELSNGEAPINLIHRDDCIGILMAIIKNDAFGHIFNAVHPSHPKKTDYYTNKAIELGLEVPQYEEENKTTFKQIDSLNLDKILGYKFKQDL